MEDLTVRNSIIEYLKTLPDDVTLDDVMYYLYVRKKIFKGEEESEAGLGISEEEFEQRVDSWFK